MPLQTQQQQYGRPVSYGGSFGRSGSVSQPYVLTDLRGNITSCMLDMVVAWSNSTHKSREDLIEGVRNRAAEQFYQWNAEEVLGLNILDFLVPSNLKKTAKDILVHVGKGESWAGQYPSLRRDGYILNTMVAQKPLVDEEQGIIGISFSSESYNSMPQVVQRSYSEEGLGRAIDDNKVLDVTHSGQKLSLEPPPPDGEATGRNLLKLGRTSVQQLLRKLHIGSWEGEETSASPKRTPERQNSWESEHEKEFLQERNQRSSNRLVANNTLQNDSSVDSMALPLVVIGHGAGPYMMGRDGEDESAGFQVLSRTSSGNAANSVSQSPNIASVQGSSVEANSLRTTSLSGPVVGINLKQAEEDFHLQLALALRVAAEAAAVDDPDLSANMRGPHGSKGLMPGVSKVEATAYRYWVSNCLGYEDRIEDGFYEVWGMSPYVWSMCTDSNELGRMPPLESLRSCPTDAIFEVVLVDRDTDVQLRELEDKAVGIAYRSQEVLDLAAKLAQLVADQMGGSVQTDEQLVDAWNSNTFKLTQQLGSLVLPIGLLHIGLGRHRALLFKWIADSVGLPCRLVRGSSYCGKEEDAMVVIKCNDEREWMVDLLIKPGQITNPDSRLAAPPAVIASPLQFERPSIFNGSNVSVNHWARGESGGAKNGNASNASKASKSTSGNDTPVATVPVKTVPFDPDKSMAPVRSPRAQNYPNTWRGGIPSPRGLALPQPFDFTPQAFDPSSISQIAKERELEKENSQPRDRDQQYQGSQKSQNQDGFRGRFASDSTDNEGSGRPNEKGSSSGQEDDNFRRARLGEFAREFEILWEDLMVGDRIGQGSYGKVYRADWQGSDVAVKVFLEQDIKVEALDEFKREVAIMRRLRHPNVVLFMGAVTVPPNLSIVTEFCPRGSLYRLLHRPNRELDERRRIRMALDVAKGMNYLHRSSPPIVHRDLKSPNLLVDKNWTVKVCDFGLSRQKHNTFLTSKSSAGTPEWMAPEVLRNELSDEKSDVYSFGVILWELATLQQPWAGMNPIQVVGAVGFQNRRLTIPETVDSAIANIIQACWRMDPRQRPSFSDIMAELKPLAADNARTPRPGAPGTPGGQRQSSPQGEPPF